MSQYSLEILNSEKYVEDFEEIILYNFDHYFMQEHFKVGKGIEENGELEHALLFHRILCTDNCTIIEYVKDKLSGKLERPRKRNKRLGELLRTVQEQENCNEEKAIES